MKRTLVRIPVLGYLLRIVSSIVFLPRHMTRIKHGLQHHQHNIEQLNDSATRTNRQVILLGQRIAQLEAELQAAKKSK